MKKFHHQRQGYRFFCLATAVLILVLLSIIPVKLAIALYMEAWWLGCW